MNLFNVYPRFDIPITAAKGVYVYDDKNQKYLDLYGGHGVISIGHNHPHYVKRLKQQMEKISFYSNSVVMPIQEELAGLLSKQCGYSDYSLFLCNSGAEANENALKLASFYTNKRKIVSFKNSFHGRTAAALNITDNLSLSAPINHNNFPVEFIELNNKVQLLNSLKNEDVAAVIIEGIQGVGGLDSPTNDFLKYVSSCCDQYGALLIVDEVQSGYCRSGKFFAHQHSGVKADIITVAKGMGNGFPVAGIIIHPKIEAKYGMLGTTFGGNYLACAASIAVLEIIENEALLDNVRLVSDYVKNELATIKSISKIKGEGLMLGIELEATIKDLQKELLYNYKIFTGSANNPNVLRILPPLTITIKEIQMFIKALKMILK
mgnify:CR=1 FL=1